MTDDAAVNAARKLIELWEYEDALEGTHLQPREIARLAKAITAHTEAAVKNYRAALDGTHYHHKAFEPLCTHCQAALAAQSIVAGQSAPDHK
jgi:hypothetical protein